MLLLDSRPGPSPRRSQGLAHPADNVWAHLNERPRRYGTEDRLTILPRSRPEAADISSFAEAHLEKSRTPRELYKCGQPQYMIHLSTSCVGLGGVWGALKAFRSPKH